MARVRHLRSTPIATFDVAIARAREGDSAGFQWLFDAFNRQLAGFARARGCRDVDAVASETLARAFHRADRFSGDESAFRSWLFAICRNILIDEARAEARRPRVSNGAVLGDLAAGDDVASEVVADVGDRAAELLAHLTEKQREVVSLRIVAGLSIAEVADVMDCPETAVKALQHRALRTLQKKISSAPVSPGEELSLS
ncbi:MAG: DNA-directed RNA polymerase sigma-70 factor [Acidimicrobiales bacterium]|nr:MAG: DNA-directed RNA polymerase sigma-70 factor [Acidimicrobiales bacterium]